MATPDATKTQLLALARVRRREAARGALRGAAERYGRARGISSCADSVDLERAAVEYAAAEEPARRYALELAGVAGVLALLVTDGEGDGAAAYVARVQPILDAAKGIAVPKAQIEAARRAIYRV